MNFKTITHVYAGVVVAIAAFFMSPAGMAVLAQYPKLVPIVTGIAGLAAIYHTPKTGA
jgi:hypothetical protein